VKYPPHGTTSSWPYKCFVDKLFRFQWEALELIFGHPTNFVEFDPVLLPLWNTRKRLVCHEMIDKLTDRAMRQARKAFRSGGQGSKKKKYQYDPIHILRSFDILQSCRSAVECGMFTPQVTKWTSEIRPQILSHSIKRKKIVEYLKMTLHQLKNLQLEVLRAPTKREVYRGEEPVSPIPSILSPGIKRELRTICERVWSDIKEGKTGRRMSEEELAILTDGQPAVNPSSLDPEYNIPRGFSTREEDIEAVEAEGCELAIESPMYEENEPIEEEERR